jgi:biopolymer transport protein ExbB
LYPLLLCSILALTFGIERLYHFLRAGSKNKSIKDVMDFIEKGELDNALRLLKNIPGPVAVVVEAIVNRDKNRQEIEEAISIKGSYELNRLNKNLHIVELIGRIAPLLGLLGTVLGMVEAFQKVSSVKGAYEPPSSQAGYGRH